MLRKKARQSEQESLFTPGAAHGPEPAASTGDGQLGDYISAFSGIMGARSIIDGALAALPLVLRLLPDEKVKKLLGRAAREFGGGYLKWKAVELGYRFLRRYIVSLRHEHKAEKQKQH